MSSRAIPARQTASDTGLVTFFLFLYPLIFFPGSLFSNPVVLTSGSLQDAFEQFLLYPKLLLLLTVALLGVLWLMRTRYPLPPLVLAIVLIGAGLVTISSFANASSLSFQILGGRLRFDGLVYQIALIVFGVYMYALLRQDPQRWKTFFKALVLGCMLQSLIVLAQGLGFDPIGPLLQWKQYSYPIGTIAHPGMVAGLFLPVLLVGVWMVVQPKLEQPWFWWAGVLLIATGLGAVQNRSALLALIVALLVLVVLERRPRAVFLSAAILAWVVLVPSFLKVFNQSEAYQKQYVQQTTLSTRFELWGMAAAVIQQNPKLWLIGGGSNFFLETLIRNPDLNALARFYRLEFAWPQNTEIKQIQMRNASDPEIRNRFVEIEFSRFDQKNNHTELFSIPDRAHSFYLDKLIAFGLPVLLIWLLIYGYPLLRGLGSQTAARGIACALVALGIYYSTWFAVMQTEPIHLSLALMGWALLQDSQS